MIFGFVPFVGPSAFAEVVMRRKARMVGMKMTLRSPMRMMTRSVMRKMTRRSTLRRMKRRSTLRRMKRRSTLRMTTRRSTLRKMTVRRSLIRKMTVRKGTMLVPFARKEIPEVRIVRTSGVVVETREAAGGADTAIGDVGAKIQLLRLCRLYRQILLLYRQILLLHRSHSRSWCR